MKSLEDREKHIGQKVLLKKYNSRFLNLFLYCDRHLNVGYKTHPFIIIKVLTIKF